MIMETAGPSALYAHLAPGSVAVTRGQPVRGWLAAATDPLGGERRARLAASVR